jgi:hypothetical protein
VEDEHPTSGNYYIQDKQGRVICWVYSKSADTANHKKPSEEEALMIVKDAARKLIRTLCVVSYGPY